MTQVVTGMGQIGSAIFNVLSQAHDVYGYDIDDDRKRGDWFGGPVQALHVCFPWTSPKFVTEVRRQVQGWNPALTIIHSTVPVGTSKHIGAVHSPVTGKHPNLTDSIFAFTKFFGGERAEEAAAIFQRCGVRVEVAPSSDATERGKLWQTLQYGWLIALQKEAYRAGDGEFIYDRMNAAYNSGYAALGEPYRLPILKNMPGPIGGHCVVPNLDLTDNRLAELLSDYNDTW